ncbi:hypothetical protein BX667DRAFT_515161 [Coemansia mojavensis]|nr:hypothetical protein BX667DRAFT_515161 [Coemansia mojavensis]
MVNIGQEIVSKLRLQPHFKPWTMPEYQSSPEEPSLLEEHINASRPRAQTNSTNATAAAISTDDSNPPYAKNATIPSHAGALSARAPATANSSVYFNSDPRAAQPAHRLSAHNHSHSPPQPYVPRTKSPYAYPETQRANRYYSNSQPGQSTSYNAYYHGPQPAPYPMPPQPRAPYHMPPGYPPRTSSLPAYYSRRVLSAEEKELRRKVSHSAIEKRRRERTNAVLRNLQDMVPGLPKSGKIQKLEILEAAAEYIRRLKLTTAINSCECLADKPPCKQPCELHRHERGDSCSNTTETHSLEFSEALDPQSRLVASPESAASEATKDGSGADTLATPADVSETSSSGDPSAMKLGFLLS